MESATEVQHRATHTSAATGLADRGYLSLIHTQFFGAGNDNILKQCLIFMIATGGIWAGRLGPGGQVVPALLLTVPFIFLSGYAGQVCDKYSKRTVMLWVKICEIPIAATAFLGFYTENLWLALLSMLLLAVQSSFFGPAKFGVIPELVHDEGISLANGVINMSTNIAIILGSLAAGPLCDWYHPEPAAGMEPLLWAPGAAMIAVSFLGLLSILFMPQLQPANPTLQYDPNPFGTYIDAVRIMARGPLLFVVIAWSAFYMVGMMALMIVPEYKEILDISYTQASYLLGVLGIAIAIGSVIAGAMSGKEIRPWLVPLGAVGMTASFLVLGLHRPTYPWVAALIAAAGFFAGFYIVPLQSLIQILSSDEERGRIIGTSAAISFCFSSLGLVVYWIATNRLQMPPNRVFLICGAMALVGTIAGTWRLRSMTNPGDEK